MHHIDVYMYHIFFIHSPIEGHYEIKTEAILGCVLMLTKMTEHSETNLFGKQQPNIFLIYPFSILKSSIMILYSKEQND